MKNSFVQIQNAQDHVRTRLFSVLVFLPCRIFRRFFAGKSGKLPALDIIKIFEIEQEPPEFFERGLNGNKNVPETLIFLFHSELNDHE